MVLKRIALATILCHCIPTIYGVMDSNDPRSNGNGGLSSGGLHQNNTRSANDQGINNDLSWSSEQKNDYYSDNIDNGSQQNNSSPNYRPDNYEGDGPANNSPYQADGKRADSFIPGYENTISTADLRAHITAKRAAVSAAIIQCQGGCSISQRDRVTKFEYYSSISPLETTLPKGPVQAQLRYESVSPVSDLDHQDAELIDEYFLEGKAHVYTKNDPEPLSKISGLSATQKLGLNSSIVVVMVQEDFLDIIGFDPQSAGLPPVGLSTQVDSIIGGLIFTSVPVSLDEPFNEETLRTIAHESYHAGERAIVSTADAMMNGEIELDEDIITGANSATIINNINTNPKDHISAASSFIIDVRLPEVMNQPGVRFGEKRNYTNTLIEARAYISEGAINPHTDEHWNQSIQEDYPGITPQEASEIIESFKSSEAIKEIMDNINSAAQKLL
jgi:hypothetical protein